MTTYTLLSYGVAVHNNTGDPLLRDRKQNRNRF